MPSAAACGSTGRHTPSRRLPFAIPPTYNLPRSLQNSFLGLDYATRNIIFADAGTGKFSTSTMSNTALALNRCLLNPELTKNQVVYISDFATSQVQLVAALERVGGQEWMRESVDSGQAAEEYQKRYQEGEHAAVYKLIELGFVTGRYGGHLENEEKIWNEVLGLPAAELDEVVRVALEAMA